MLQHVPVFISILLLCMHRHSDGLYHTMGDTLHWFSHMASKRPDDIQWQEIPLNNGHKMGLASISSFNHGM